MLMGCRGWWIEPTTPEPMPEPLFERPEGDVMTRAAHCACFAGPPLAGFCCCCCCFSSDACPLNSSLSLCSIFCCCCCCGCVGSCCFACCSACTSGCCCLYALDPTINQGLRKSTNKRDPAQASRDRHAVCQWRLQRYGKAHTHGS